MKRLFKSGVITTLIGIGFMIAAGYVALIDKDMKIATFLGGYGLIFLRTKDSLIGIKEKEDATN